MMDQKPFPMGLSTAARRTPGRKSRKLLQAAAAVGAVLICSWEAHAGTCADLYSAIKSEAKDCGFFCDQAKLRPLQEAYSATCIHVVLPLAPFDLDSVPQDPLIVAQRSGNGAEVASVAPQR
jgi:hypothetical protein